MPATDPTRAQVQGLKVVDMGVGMAAALLTQLLGHCGATVHRVEPEGGDPFHEVYDAYRLWRRDSLAADRGQLDALLADADICILGGEDYPGLIHGVDPRALQARYPGLVVISLTGYSNAALRGRPAVDLLVQARTGASNEQSAIRPIQFAFPMPTYGQALLAASGGLAAVSERLRTGRGQVVEISMEQGMAMWMPAAWTWAERATPAFNANTPKDVKPLTFRCADGEYVNMIFGTPGSVYQTYKVLGIDLTGVDPADRGMPNREASPENYLGDRTLMAPYFGRQTRAQLLEGFWAVGLAADAVLRPGEVWDTEQAGCNGIIHTDAEGWRTIGNPVASTLRAAGPPSAMPAPANGPLDGVRVLDLGNWVAGPFAGKFLADMGADVIKVEPLEGTPHRSLYRSFASANRGKRSLSVDLKSPEGVAIVQRLAATADLANQNLRMGVAERIGIGDAQLRAVNPGLITLHTTAYGDTGPKAYNSGWDPIMQPYCGHAIRGGGQDNEPIWYMSPIVDYGTGALNAVALLSALVQRQRSGHGQTLGTNLLDVGLWLMSELIQAPDGGFRGAAPLDHERGGVHPAEHLYQARDGWVAIAARSEAAAGRLAAVLGLELGARAAWGPAEQNRIAAAVAARMTDDLLTALEGAGVFAEPVAEDGLTALRQREAAQPAGLLASGEEAAYGQVLGVGSLFTFGAWAMNTTLRPFPQNGEHSREVLAEIGYSAAEIDDFVTRGVVHQHHAQQAYA